MLCPKCQKQIPDDSAFCPECGSAVAPSVSPVEEERNVIQEKKKEPFWKKGWLVISLTIITSIALITCAVTISQISSFSAEISTKNDTIATLQQESDFLHEHIGIVCDDNTNLYHKYGCSKIESATSFMAFNTEYAEYLGYSPCPDCCK